MEPINLDVPRVPINLAPVGFAPVRSRAQRRAAERREPRTVRLSIRRARQKDRQHRGS